MKFKLTANCILVKGAKRSAICDLHRMNIFMVPNELANVLPAWENKTREEIKRTSREISEAEIEDCISFLLENELAFFTDTPEWFPEMDMQWHAPFEITNSIIDIDNVSNFNIFNVLQQLDDLNCKNLQIRYFRETFKNEIKDIIQYLDQLESMVVSVDFVLPSSKDFSQEDIENLRYENPRLSSLSFYNHHKNGFIEPIDGKRGYVVFSKEVITSQQHCGIISPQLFAINIKTFTESQHHNSCLNRKISIDTNGNIKNCPSMPESYGNIKDTALEEALNKPGFKKYWNITKDQIEVCKDCEFRHVCTDCRAYTERTKFEKDIDLSKPLKCGYNPYTNEWAEWSTNPLKERAIEYYGMEDLINRKKQ